MHQPNLALVILVVEGENHEAGGWSSVNGSYGCGSDGIATAKFFKPVGARRRALRDSLETLGIGHGCDVNDDISGRLRLCVQSFNCEGTYRDADKRCQAWYEKALHSDLPTLSERIDARSTGAHVCGIANADDIRETAIFGIPDAFFTSFSLATALGLL